MTVSTTGPLFVVDAPRPVAPKYRLLDVANIIDEPDPHWQNGLSVWGYPPDVPQSWDPCSTGTFRPKDEGGTIPMPEFGSFMVYLSETCTPRAIFEGVSPQDGGESNESYLARIQAAYVNRALASFEAAESFAVEREFAQGVAIPGNPHLADSNADVLNSGTATAPRAAGAYLANALGATGRGGIIHADPATVFAWGSFRSYRDSDALFTTEGTPIAEGTGYIGTVPVGQGALAAGTSWAFATGPVDIRRSQPLIYPANFSQAFDRAQNTVTFRVERVYAVDWDAVLQAAVLVNWAATTP